MYNEELKAKFIKNYTSSVSTSEICRYLFNSFEPYEKKWGADLCTKSAAELQPVIDNIAGLRVRSKWMKLIILKDYVKWCINVENIPNACDGMLEINSVGLDKVRQQTVSSPLHLQKYLDGVYDKAEEKTTDNIYRCYHWLAFGGVAEEDILKIKCSDVDLSSMIVHYGNTEVPIYREAIPAFKNCIELTQFIYKNPNYSKPIYKDRIKGDTIVRGVRSSPSFKSMRVQLSKRAKEKEEETGMRLSYNRIWLSGVFYRAYENELAGEKPDFRDIANQQIERKVYKLETGRNNQNARKRQLAQDYMKDYQRWKLAFKI